MFRPVTQCIAVFFFVIVVKDSDQYCFESSTHDAIKCDSLKDLYTERGILAKHITIVDQAEHDQELKSVPLEVAKYCEFLAIESSLNKIGEDSLVNFTNLRYLHLKYNKLSEIPPGTFKNLNITWLFFEGNYIKSVAPLAFINLTNLEHLILRESNLTKISFNVFNNLPVSSLLLSDNNISEIEKFSFGNMPNLRVLYLENNQLTEFIPQEQLYYPGKLEQLGLTRNKLREVTVYMLEGLINLKYLYLDRNLISFIESKAFEKTLKLEKLYLSNNSLKVISSKVFPEGGLNNLHYLYLDHNRLMYVTSTFFIRLTALWYVSLVGNPWKCPCLDLVYRWLHDKRQVKLIDDRGYQLGKWPVCVMPDGNICTYTYDEDLFKVFQNHSRQYYPPS